MGNRNTFPFTWCIKNLLIIMNKRLPDETVKALGNKSLGFCCSCILLLLFYVYFLYAPSFLMDIQINFQYLFFYQFYIILFFCCVCLCCFYSYLFTITLHSPPFHCYGILCWRLPFFLETSLQIIYVD